MLETENGYVIKRVDIICHTLKSKDLNQPMINNGKCITNPFPINIEINKNKTLSMNELICKTIFEEAKSLEYHGYVGPEDGLSIDVVIDGFSS